LYRRIFFPAIAGMKKAPRVERFSAGVVYSTTTLPRMTA
jgi:hypothetical protein